MQKNMFSSGSGINYMYTDRQAARVSSPQRSCTVPVRPYGGRP